MGDLGDRLPVWLWLVVGVLAVVAAFAVGSVRGRKKEKEEEEADAERRRPSTKDPPASKSKRASRPDATAKSPPSAPASRPLPKIEYEEDAEVDPTMVGGTAASVVHYQAQVKPLVYDEDAAKDEPTDATALIATSGSAQTDGGLRRKRNEDNLLVAEDHALYVVADGMGGYAGGALASTLAVKTIGKAFESSKFDGTPHDSLPRRASELARAIQMANAAIHARATADPNLDGMGTTVVAARFSANKQRLYIGHVGDSRVYRLREGTLRQMTEDHTMADFGIEGPQGAHLSRAVGVWPVVPIDIVLVKPKAGDVYLLCSDGLTKMVDDDVIEEILRTEACPSAAVAKLVDAANAGGGKDNITVIVVRVEAPVTDQRAA